MTNTPHGLGPTRARVLGLLQAATEPTSVVEVADELGLHKNSARFHLDALVDAGYAERAVNATGTQGRPPLVFSATSEAPSISNLHLTELVQVLISSFIEPTDDARARAEGQAAPGVPRSRPRNSPAARPSPSSPSISVSAGSAPPKTPRP